MAIKTTETAHSDLLELLAKGEISALEPLEQTSPPTKTRSFFVAIALTALALGLGAGFLLWGLG